MAAYRFYAPADAAQDKIWRDTVDTWGEAQAETYIRGLHAHLQRLCDNDLLWRRLPQKLAVPGDLKSEAYFSRYQHHYLFFRKLDNG
ncbi:type II toxin-antitoxin system RelE/ParE family toxin [Agrobacterium rhizogenes]|uniref:type II toxin-antitoxin system RelE/ParE family toxin n=1 Tax=Rhizobium rhizogenes TaxID=359 RepID=UPI0022B6C1B4|nr:type II toxin-antitoxin system RelE/ParE family toxin [Rhizobium rhizogenes]MCZ7451117.1 type II toxin-antitoxin system RelE/ParE family toxin [Rhizobium rhizogenes]